MSPLVLSPHDDRAEWDRRGLGGGVHMLAAYARVQELSEPGAQAIMVASGDGMAAAAQVFLRRSIPVQPQSYDLTSLYAYGGVRALNSRAILRLQREVAGLAPKMRLVSEFCLVNPTIAEMGVPHDCDIRAVKPVVIASPAIPAFRPDKRQAIRRAGESRVEVATPAATDEAVRAFVALYRETMERHRASLRWCNLRDDYFAAYFSELPDNAQLFFAEFQPQTGTRRRVAAALVVHDHNTAYYHFAGSRSDMPRGAADLLISKIIEWANAKGIWLIVLGGGVTAADDDSLLHFKSGFGVRHQLYRYFRIFDRPAYDALAALRGGPAPADGFEPIYRKEQLP